jgi:hypothetical protein
MVVTCAIDRTNMWRQMPRATGDAMHEMIAQVTRATPGAASGGDDGSGGPVPVKCLRCSGRRTHVPTKCIVIVTS